MVLGALTGLLAYGVVAKARTEAQPVPVKSNYFPATPAYQLPGSKGLNRDKHPDPNKYGRPSDTRNGRGWVPRIEVKSIVSMQRKWPVNSEVWRELDREQQIRSKLNKPWGDSTWLLKSPLFCANNRRYGPRILTRVDNVTVGTLKDGSSFVSFEKSD